MTETLLIVGASVRAAAQSARRAGFRVSAVDLFGDVDLQAIAPTWQVSPSAYPEGLIAAAKQAPAGPWMYTGGLENYPQVVAEIRKERELLGVTSVLLHVSRSPLVLDELCGLNDFPSTILIGENLLPTAGTWLLKPRRSSGGLHIQLFHEPPYPPAGNHQYYSFFVEGVPQSAVYLLAQGGCRLLGVTEQLCGMPWAGASTFAYAGSIGPFDIPASVHEQYVRLGECLIPWALHGLIGIDTILGHDGRIYPLEINPRYTASIEILERALHLPAIAWHVEACRDNALPAYDWQPADSCAAQGKVIVYAKKPATISDAFLAWCLAQNERSGRWPALADLPHAGTSIQPGHPILTAFASGGCAESVRWELQQRAAEIYQSLDRLRRA